jgi:hypothetical protein
VTACPPRSPKRKISPQGVVVKGELMGIFADSCPCFVRRLPSYFARETGDARPSDCFGVARLPLQSSPDTNLLQAEFWPAWLRSPFWGDFRIACHLPKIVRRRHRKTDQIPIVWKDASASC